MKRFSSKAFALSVGLLASGCVGGTSAQDQYVQLVASNHEDISNVTMPVDLAQCPSSQVQQYSLVMPVSAMSCVGFLNSYYSNSDNIYNHPDIRVIARNADQQCRYPRSIDLSAADPNSDDGQYRIGQLTYSNTFNFIINAERARDYGAAAEFRQAMSNYRATCLNMINHARALYYSQ